MPFVHCFVVITIGISGFLGIVKQVFGRFIQRPLVPFQGQDVVGVLGDDLLCDLGLTAERVNGHNTTGDGQDFQQVGDSRNLVRLFSYLELA